MASRICPQCGSEVPESSNFCNACGYQMDSVQAQAPEQQVATGGAARICPNCGSEVPAGASFCESCGSRMDAGAQQPAGMQPDQYSQYGQQPGQNANQYGQQPDMSTNQYGQQPNQYGQGGNVPQNMQDQSGKPEGGTRTAIIAVIIAAVAVIIIMIIMSLTSSSGTDYAEETTVEATIEEEEATEEDSTTEEEAAEEESTTTEESGDSEMAALLAECGTFEETTVSGSGDEEFDFPMAGTDTPMLIYITNESSSDSDYFSVITYDDSGTMVDFYSSYTGSSYSGVFTNYDDYELGIYEEPATVEVTSSGDWTITYTPMSSMEQLVNGQTYQADQVLYIDEDALGQIEFSCPDAGYCYVDGILVGDDFDYESLVLEFGGYEGTLEWDNPQSVIVVESDSSWTATW